MGPDKSLKRQLAEMRDGMRADGRTWREVALAVQDRFRVNALVAFRLAHGWTQGEVADRYNAAWPGTRPKSFKHVSYWENWEPGAPASSSSRTPSHQDLDRLAQLYECSVADLLGGADYSDRDSNAVIEPEIVFTPAAVLPHDGGNACGVREDPTKRRDALKLGLLAAATPEVLHRILREATGEAMEFTRQAGATGIGAGTFAHLEAVVTSIDRAYNVESPVVLFSTARAYRSRVAGLIEGAHTLKEGRELYAYAAWLSEALAWLSHKLGDPLAAEAWAIDAFEHADQAGHDELCAWAMDAMTSSAFYTGRPADAVSAARRGLAKAPAAHPIAVCLRTQAARAHARLGQHEECEALLGEARDLHERLPAQTPVRLATDTGPLASFAITDHAASAYNSLRDFQKAKAHAESAITLQENLPEAARSASRDAIARIDLGVALAELGVPDKAAALGRQVLATPAPHCVPVRSRAGDLDRTLAARYPKLAVVRDFHEEYRELVRGSS